MAFLLSKLMRNIVILYILFSGVQWGLKAKTYTISPKEFKNIASKAQGGTIQSAVTRIGTDLKRLYGPAVATETQWTSLSLGGHSLRAFFLHASLTEYVAVFGAPFASTGRIGLHWSNSTCTVLSGVVTRSVDSPVAVSAKESFSVGGNFRHGQFESAIYSLGDETYVACYGRGVIPVSGVWAFTGALAHGEPLNLLHVFYAYGQSAFNNLSLAAMKTFDYYKNKATGGKTEL